MNIPDYKNTDYRGFIFLVHVKYGMLLLHCTRKPKKGPHYQLPGGHVDDFEFEYAAEKCGPSTSENQVLLEACKMGATRELFEETGLDFRGQLDRVIPAPLKSSKDGDDLNCMLKHKCYFTINVSDEDFKLGEGYGVNGDEGNQEGISSLIHPQNDNGAHLMLQISHEHSGFIFENDPWETIKKIKNHSGGTGSAALRMSMMLNQKEKSNPRGAGDENDNEYDHPRYLQHQAKKIHVEVYNDDIHFDEGMDLLPPPSRRGVGALFACFQRCC